MATAPVFLAGKSHGQRSLVGCRLWGRKESDVTECAGTVFFMVQLSHPYVTTGKTKAWILCAFVSKVMSLIFNRHLAYKLKPDKVKFCTASALPRIFLIFRTAGNIQLDSSCFFNFISLYFWPHWVFVTARRLSLVVACGIVSVVAAPAVEQGL